MPAAPRGAQSVMEENWEALPPRATPGRPMQNAQQPPRNQMGRKAPPTATPVSGRKPVPYSAALGTGVRQANYDQ
jgi:hypothetical protein